MGERASNKGMEFEAQRRALFEGERATALSEYRNAMGGLARKRSMTASSRRKAEYELTGKFKEKWGDPNDYLGPWSSGGTEGKGAAYGTLFQKQGQELEKMLFQEKERMLKTQNRLDLSNEQLKIDEKVFKLQEQSNSMFGQSNDQQIKKLALKQKELAETKKLKEIELKYGKDSREAELQTNEILKAQLELKYHLSDEQVRQAQLWRQVGDAIESSIVRAIESAITKAESLQDIVSSLLLTVGRMFLNAGVSSWVDSWAEGGHVKGGFKAFDQGGVVGEPTLGLEGEGGESEYIIPESKMSDAMDRYAAGSRGNDVLAGGVVEGGGGESGGSSSGVIDVNVNSHVINDVSYVTYADFQDGIQQAAIEGAKRGQQATMRTLQTSSSARKRIGV